MCRSKASRQRHQNSQYIYESPFNRRTSNVSLSARLFPGPLETVDAAQFQRKTKDNVYTRESTLLIASRLMMSPSDHASDLPASNEPAAGPTTPDSREKTPKSTSPTVPPKPMGLLSTKSSKLVGSSGTPKPPKAKNASPKRPKDSLSGGSEQLHPEKARDHAGGHESVASPPTFSRGSDTSAKTKQFQPFQADTRNTTRQVPATALAQVRQSTTDRRSVARVASPRPPTPITVFICLVHLRRNALLHKQPLAGRMQDCIGVNEFMVAIA